MNEQNIIDHDTRVEAAKTLLIESNAINESVNQLRKVLCMTVPTQALKLMDDVERKDELTNAIAELYADQDFTIEELDLLIKFYSSDLGKKVCKVNVIMQPKILEITQDWLYEILEDALREELEPKDGQNDTKTKEAGESL